ncbi:sulfurtransferase TusA family protein [Cohnella suwonensis]|uniref:Sulfurtransferase TusA family protein n=1 Tax=Cohnella suwonensis TaxID=696072 RepID=A0ABW0LVI2_9BACL
MTATFTANQVLDCKGLACPMPIVRTKKAIEALKPGEVIEMQATDKGSLADIQGWAKNTGHQYLGTLHEGNVLKHYVRKASADEEKAETTFERTISNDELLDKLEAKAPIVVLDVREPAEYGFGHIPGAVSIPLGELENRLGELPKDNEIYAVCRTGKRSNYACLLLNEKGYRATNVVPGMTDWTGPKEGK